MFHMSRLCTPKKHGITFEETHVDQITQLFVRGICRMFLDYSGIQAQIQLAFFWVQGMS